MNENNHTPGPWVVITELRPTDEIVCDMLNSGYVAITQGQKLANWRNDAKLIAAAPDLFEAAEIVASSLAKFIGPLDIEYRGLIQIRAAIAKAKGE